LSQIGIHLGYTKIVTNTEEINSPNKHLKTLNSLGYNWDTFSKLQESR